MLLKHIVASIIHCLAKSVFPSSMLSLMINLGLCSCFQGDSEPAAEGRKKQRLLVSFGGMDTVGQIFDDVFAIAVE